MDGYDERTGIRRKALAQIGMIDDEELWPDALKTRNNVAHSYNQAIALDIVRQTKERYYPMFLHLKKNRGTLDLKNAPSSVRIARYASRIRGHILNNLENDVICI